MDKPQEDASDTVDGNERYIAYTSPIIRSVDELLDAFKVNREEWVVVKQEAGTWTVGSKPTKKHLSWSNGKITEGEIIEQGELVATPMFKASVVLVRRDPVAVFPTIQPIVVSTPPSVLVPRQRTDFIRALHVADPHFGFKRSIGTGALTPTHDRLAISVMLQIALDGNFNYVVYHGDWLDLAEWTDKFVKLPEYYWTTQPALIELGWINAKLRSSLPFTRILAVEGNHDMRSDNQIITHLVSAYQLKAVNELHLPPSLSLERLLCLDEMGIEYTKGYPDAEAWIENRVRCIHGDVVKGDPGATAAAVVDRANVTTVFGHIHRIEMATKTVTINGTRRQITAFCPGCLCRVDGEVPGSKQSQSWQQGLGVVTLGPNGYESIEPISIKDGYAVWNDKVYKGVDYVEELAMDTGWPF